MFRFMLFFFLSPLLMATTPTYENLTKLYVATFNRAPDAAGVKYWVDDSNLNLEDIARSFFDQSETQALYPSSVSNRDFIESVYKNLFNREPDATGWDYWETQLDSGAVGRGVFILAVINGAQDTAQYGNDKTILDNKGLAGLYFALYGYNDINFAKSIMQSLSDDETSLQYARDIMYEHSGISDKTSCVVDLLYNDGEKFTLCYEDVAIDTCNALQDSDYESSWYGLPIKGECTDLGYPEDSQTLTSDGSYIYYGRLGLYGDGDDYININGSALLTQQGGEEKLLDIYIEAPQDAVYASQDIRAGKLSVTDDDSVSAEYAISLELDKLEKPITLKLPLSKEIDTDTPLVFQYIPSGGGYSTSGGDSPYIWMFDAELSGDYIVGDLYNFTSYTAPSSLGLWDRIKDALNPKDSIKDLYSFIQTKSMHAIKTDDGVFKIYYSVNFASFDDPTLTLIDTVKDGLQNAQDRLKNMGFVFDSIHTPIPVTLVKSSLMSSSTYKAEQTKPTKFVTNKYPMVKVNTTELLRAKNDAKVSDEMKTTLGHEFFHIVQNLYDPAWFNDGSSLFLAEASSVWFEYIMSENPKTYKADVTEAHTSFQNYGIDDKSFGKYSVWSTSKIDNIQDLGYGASSFLLYLTIYTKDDGIIYEMWKNYKDGKTAVQAIDKALQDRADTDLSNMWRRFAKDFNTGFVNFPYKDQATWASPPYSQILDASTDTSFVKSFTMPPYSANSIYIGNSSVDKEYDVDISVSESGGSIYDGDIYVYDASDKKELLKMDFDGEKATFSMDKKPSRRSIVLINSGSVKMDVTVDIQISQKQQDCPDGETLNSSGECMPAGFVENCPQTYDSSLDSGGFGYVYYNYADSNGDGIYDDYLECHYQIYKDDDHRLLSQIPYVNNEMNGIVIYYYPDGDPGVIMSEQEYVDGHLK